MAEKQAGGLSLRIGLTLSQLQSDFLAAEQTVKQGMAALNRQQNIIKLRMETDTVGLDAVTDKTKILEIQERSLNQLLEMQRDRLTLATKAYQEYANGKNVNEVVAKKLETAMEKERLAVARLEAQLKSLSAQQVIINTTGLQDSIAKLNTKIQHVKIQAEIDMSKLQGANAAFDAQKIHIAAVTKEIELQRQKLAQLQETMYRSAKLNGGDSVQTLNIKSNVLQQIQEIQKLETKLKELRNTRIDLQIRADSFKQVEAQIHENISRLNAKLENIKVKTEIDVSKLGAAASEFDKAKAHVKGLTHELDLQRQKLAELQKAMYSSARTNGVNSTKTIGLQTEIRKQIQAIDQLKAKIDELNKIQPPKTNNLLSSYLNIKGDVAGKLNEITTAFSQLQGATSSADSAITSVLGVIGTIPHPVGRAAVAIASLPILFKGVENSIVSLTEAAASAGDSVYVMSRGFQMSIADTGKFTSMCKTAGVEVNDLASTIRRTQQQIIRGGDNAKGEQWLKRYGESAFDANGKLKDLNEMTLTLSRALKRAQAEGNGMAFILGTMRNASADAITAIEDAEGVYEQASTIVKNGLANPALAHEVQGNINAMKLQASQLNGSFTSALLPVANEVIPRLTERMGKMTTLIKDNKDVILDFGRDLASVWGAVENGVDKVADGFSVIAKLARENRVVRQTSTKDILEKYKDDTTVLTAKDLLQREIDNGGYTAEDKVKFSSRRDLYQKELKRVEEEMKDLYRERRKAFAEKYQSILEKYKSDEDIKTMTDLLNKLTDAEKELISQDTSPFFKSLQEKVGALNLELKKLRETTADTKKELEELLKKPLSGANASAIGQERQTFEDNDELLNSLREARKYRENAQAIIDKLNLNDYQKQLFDRDKWLQEQLPRDAEQSLKKYQAVMEEYKAWGLQIEQERADKLKDIRDGVAAADKTALENKLDNIEKERQAWLKAGMDEAEAVELAQKKIAKAYEESAEKVQGYLKNAADIEYELTHTAFEKQIRDIERWEELQKRKAESVEESAAIGAEAAAREAQAFEREMDRIKGKLQSLDDKIFEIDHSQYENDLHRIQQEYLRQAEELSAEGALTPEVQAKLDYLYQRQKFNLDQRAAESRAKGGDYTKAPKGATQWGGYGVPIIQADQIFGSNFMTAHQREVGLMAEENQIRANLLTKLDASAQAEVEKIESAKALMNAQQGLIQQTTELASQPTFQGTPVGSATVIQGDEITQISPEDVQKVLEEQRRGQEILAQSMTKPTQELNQFGVAVQEKASEIEHFDSLKILSETAQGAIDAQKNFSEALKDFPPEYFKTLADGTKSVSDMQLALTDSTMKLIDAQDKLSQKFSEGDSSREISSGQMLNDGLKSLSTSTQRITKEQDLLSRTTRETNDRLSQISAAPRQKDSGFKFWFDSDVFSNIAEPLLGFTTLLTTLGAIAPIPAIKAGAMILGGAAGAGAAIGSFNKTHESREVNKFDDHLQPLPADIDLSEIIRPLGDIEGNVSSILQEMQGRETTLSFETVVTPLNNIEGLVANILAALNDRQPPQITVSPTISNDLGGAYVFDNALKKELVDDITSQIVDEIISAVQQATSRSNYNYGA